MSGKTSTENPNNHLTVRCAVCEKLPLKLYTQRCRWRKIYLVALERKEIQRKGNRNVQVTDALSIASIALFRFDQSRSRVYSEADRLSTSRRDETRSEMLSANLSHSNFLLSRDHVFVYCLEESYLFVRILLVFLK